VEQPTQKWNTWENDNWSGTTDGRASNSSRITVGSTEHLAKYLDHYSIEGIDFFIWHIGPMNLPLLQTFRSICQAKLGPNHQLELDS
jgi:hypothetical protein